MTAQQNNHNTASKKNYRSTSKHMALEQRLLFDGAGMVAAVDGFADTVEQEVAPSAHDQPVEQENIPFSAESRELVIIDSRVEGYQELIPTIGGDAIIYVVDSDESGLALISNALADTGEPFDAIHIISHGTPGSFTLGSDQVNSDTLVQQAALFASWADYLTDDADILLYGCDIAQGETGDAFIYELAAITGADIAASTNATGNESAGGDWVLESSTGSIEANNLELFGLMGVLDGGVEVTDTIKDGTALLIGENDKDIKIAKGIELEGNGSYTITVTTNNNDSLSATTTTGTIAEINDWLANLTYTYTGTSEKGDIDILTIKIDDQEIHTRQIAISPQNDAPTVSSPDNLTLDEGAALTFGDITEIKDIDHKVIGFTHAGLGITDPDNKAEQVMLKITTVPADGEGKLILEKNGVTTILEEGSLFSAADIQYLKLEHSGKQVLDNNQTLSFSYTINDGAGGIVENNTVSVKLNPVNQAPSLSGSELKLIQGEDAISIGSGGKLPVLGGGNIDRGQVTGSDPENETLTYKITSLPTVNDEVVGKLYYDGVELTENNIASTSITDLNLLTYEYPAEKEPHELGADPVVSFKLTVTDQGGGTGVPATSAEQEVKITILDNNNDPVLDKNSQQNFQTLKDAEPSKVNNNAFYITNDMLNITDPDSMDSNIVFTVTSEVAENAGGYFTINGLLLSAGSTFTLEDLKPNDNGETNIQYHLRSPNASGEEGDDRIDSFDFTVKDSGIGIIFPDEGEAFQRDGGIYESQTPGSELKVHTFEVLVPHTITEDGKGGDLPGLPPQSEGGLNPTVSPVKEINEGTGTIAGTSGKFITSNNLEIKDEIDDGQGGKTTITSPEGIVYRIEALPDHGSIWLNGKELNQFDTFTQADLNDGDKIEYRHHGDEVFIDTLVLSASNGKITTASNITLELEITPQNDTPVASQQDIVHLKEGKEIVITSNHINITDSDKANPVADDVNDEYANKNDLWFVISELPNKAVAGDYIGDEPTPTIVGYLEWFDGNDWIEITSDNRTDFNGNGQITLTDLDAGKLRYVHNGTEDFSDSFTITPYDNMGVEESQGTNLTSQGKEIEIKISIAPVNNPPQIVAGDKKDVYIYEGQEATIWGQNASAKDGYKQDDIQKDGQLVFVDQDNTKLQNQYLIHEAPKHGTLYLDGVALAKDAVFSQDDLDAGLITYVHNGSEEHLDSFKYTVSDGDYTVNDDGVTTTNTPSTFNIYIKPTNDKPEFDTIPAASKPLIVDSTNSRHNITTDFQIADLDLEEVTTGEHDLITAIVRIVDSTGQQAVLDGNDGSYTISVDTTKFPAGSNTATNDHLIITGTLADVNAALETLGVGFSDDLNSKGDYKLQVIIDDRTNAAGTAYQNGGADVKANGGDQNKKADGELDNVDDTEYNWTTAVITEETSLNLNVAQMDLWISTENEAPTISTPNDIAVQEDVPTKLTGIQFTDPESTAFGTDVTVTLTVNDGKLTAASGNGVTVSGSGSSTVTLTGTVTAINAFLDEGTGVSYTTAKDVNHDTNEAETFTGGDVTLTVTISEKGTVNPDNLKQGSAIGNDPDGTGSVANDPVSKNIAINITAINDAPVVGNADSNNTVNIDSANWIAVGGFAITDVDANDGYAAGENNGIIQATVRIVDKNGAPLTSAIYDSSKISFSSTVDNSGVAVDPSLQEGTDAEDSYSGALRVYGTLEQINDYLAGLQVKFGALEGANLDGDYKVEVIVDDRIYENDGGWKLALDNGEAQANGGLLNQNAANNNVADIPTTPAIDPYTQTVTGYAVYNTVSNTRDIFVSTLNDPAQIHIAGDTPAEAGKIILPEADNNATVKLTGLSISDSDAQADDLLTITLELPDGFVFDNNNSTSITYTGTQTAINAWLANTVEVKLPKVGDAESHDWNGEFTVNVTVNDGGNTGVIKDTGYYQDSAQYNPEEGIAPDNAFEVIKDDANKNASITTTRAVTFVVTPTNDAPVVTDQSAVTFPAVNEDTAEPASQTVNELFGDRFSDPKDQINNGTANNGVDATAGSVSDTFFGIAIVGNSSISDQGEWQYYDGNDWVNIGARSESSALVLDKDTQIRFLPKADFHGTPGELKVHLVEDNSNGDTVTGIIPEHKGEVNLTTNTVGGSTVFSADTIQLTTTVSNVNDAPSFQGDATFTVNEDTEKVISAADIVSQLTFDDSKDNQTAIAGGENAATDLTAIAIIGNAADADQGVWEYTIDGTNWLNIPTGDNADKAIILDPANASHQVKFIPADDYNGPAGQLTIIAADATYTGNKGIAEVDLSNVRGDTHPWSADNATLSPTVNAVNDAPSLGDATATNPTATEDGGNNENSSTNKVQLADNVTVSDIDLDTDKNKNVTDHESKFTTAAAITVTLDSYFAGDQITLEGDNLAGTNITNHNDGTWTISFTDAVTEQQVSDIIEAIRYHHVGDNPTNFGDRNSTDYTITFSDGGNYGTGDPETASLTGTITIVDTNDKPVITLENKPNDPLPVGTPDKAADYAFVSENDLGESGKFTGTVNFTDVDTKSTDLSVTLDKPAVDALQSGDENIVWELSNDNQTLTGTANGQTVIQVVVTNDPSQNKATYEVTLLGPIDHADAAGKNLIGLEIPVIVTDSKNPDSLLTDTSTIHVTIEDSVPVANADSNNIGTGSYDAVTGNVITADDNTNSADAADTVMADGATVTTVISGDKTANPAEVTTPVNVSTTIQGEYGTLTINPDGSYSYQRDINKTAGGVNDVFTYTITDFDGDTATTTLTINIADDKPVFVDDSQTPIVEDNGKFVVTGGTVKESGLTNGSSPSEGDRTTTGTINYKSGDGTEKVTIKDKDGHEQVLVPVDMQNRQTIEVENGTITITKYEPENGIIEYKYELTSPVTGTNGNDEESISFDVTVTDLDNDATTLTVEITVIDDAPIARNDANEVTENDLENTAKGNVIGSSSTTPPANTDVADTVGADGATVTGAKAGELDGGQTHLADGGVSAVLNGTYGTLTIDAQGNYTYTLDNNRLETQGLIDGQTETDIFTYTITDGDGDQATAQIIISVHGTNDDVTLTIPTEHNVPVNDKGVPTAASNYTKTNDHVVFESGLATGSNPSADAITVNSSFTLKALDGLDDADGLILTVGDQTLTLGRAAIEALSTTPSDMLTTEYGTLVLNGYSQVADGTITINYTYTLTSAPENDAPNAGTDDSDKFVFDNITIKANDRDTDNATQTLSIKIIDDAPTANNDSFTQAVENKAVTGDVLADNGNGADVFGADGKATPTVSLVANSLTGDGELVLNTDGTFTYTPAKGEGDENGKNITFEYTITDADGDTDTATVTITLQPDSKPTVTPSYAGDDTTGVVDESALNGGTGGGSLTYSGGLTINTGNDGLDFIEVQDKNGDWIKIENDDTAVQGQYGTILVNKDGSWTYTLTTTAPHQNANSSGSADQMSETFQVRVTDDDGADESPEATITIQVNDDAPQATNDNIPLAYASSISGGHAEDEEASVLLNDELGADGAVITQVKSTIGDNTNLIPIDGENKTSIAGQYGTLEIDKEGKYTYTRYVDSLPEGTYTDIFEYTIQDSDGDTSTALINIGIKNIVPKLEAQTEELTVYESALDAGSSPSSEQRTAKGTIVFTPGNEPAAPEEDGCPCGHSIRVNSEEGYANALDASDIAVTPKYGAVRILSVSTKENGKYTIEYEYTLTDTSPKEDDSFTIIIKDTDTDELFVTVKVNIVEDEPEAVADAATVNNLTDKAIGNALTNDTLGADREVLVTNISSNNTPSNNATSDNGTLTIEGEHGTLVIEPNGEFTYTRINGKPLEATDVFTYTITDNDGDTSTATITITIDDKAPRDFTNEKGNTPVAEEDPNNPGQDRLVVRPESVKESGLDNGSNPAKTERTTSGELNFTPGDGTHTVTITDKDNNDIPLQQGTVVNTPSGKVTIKTFDPTNGQIVYEYELTTPTDSDNTTDEFTFTVTDEDGDAADITVMIDIINDAPKANADSGTVRETETLTVGKNNGLLSNDTAGADGWKSTGGVVAIEGEAVTAEGTVIQGQYGTLTVYPDGSYSYKAGDNPYDGRLSDTESFTYTVEDADGDTTTATLTIKVQYDQPFIDDSSSNVPPVLPPSFDNGTSTNKGADDLILGDQTADPSVFFDGSIVHKVPRMDVPMHPVLYVDRQVSASQEERAQDNSRNFADPASVRPGGNMPISLGSGLGQDHSLFVSHAVADSQREADYHSASVEGRYGRLDLSSDGLLPGVRLFNEDPKEVLERSKDKKKKAAAPQTNEAATAAQVASETNTQADSDELAFLTPQAEEATSATALSFNEQLIRSMDTLPLGRQSA